MVPPCDTNAVLSSPAARCACWEAGALELAGLADALAGFAAALAVLAEGIGGCADALGEEAVLAPPQAARVQTSVRPARSRPTLRRDKEDKGWSFRYVSDPQASYPERRYTSSAFLGWSER